MTEHTFNQRTNPIEAKQFYRNYVIKSIPCVFKNELANDQMFNDISSLESERDIYNYIDLSFGADNLTSNVTEPVVFNYTRITRNLAKKT